MKIYYSGVGKARMEVNQVVEQPNCPRIGETVQLLGDAEFEVKHVMSCPEEPSYDVYCVVAP